MLELNVRITPSPQLELYSKFIDIYHLISIASRFAVIVCLCLVYKGLIYLYHFQ